MSNNLEPRLVRLLFRTMLEIRNLDVRGRTPQERNRAEREIVGGSAIAAVLFGFG